MKKKSFRTLTKTDERILRERLERYYAYLLYIQYRWTHEYTSLSKTKVMLADRQLRAKLKSCEILLISLNSKLFENVKTASIRKTLTIEGKHNRDAKD